MLRQYKEIFLWSLQRWVVEQGPEPSRHLSRDRRYQEEVWINNLYLSAVKQAYRMAKLPYG